MYNNSRITFMFEKSESDNTMLFTVVQAIFLLIDASLESGVPKRVAECWALRPMDECILWWSTPCPATNLTMLLELFKRLTINLEQRQANSNLKGSKPHKSATKPEWVRVGSSQTRFNPLRLPQKDVPTPIAHYRKNRYSRNVKFSNSVGLHIIFHYLVFCALFCSETRVL